MNIKRLLELARHKGSLAPEEELVMGELLRFGYGRNGSPLGRDGAVSADTLAKALMPILYPESEVAPLEAEIARRRLETSKRKLRTIVNQCIRVHGIPIICEPGRGGGYYLPADEGEVEANYLRFFQRGMTGLAKGSRCRKSALSSTIVQLVMGFDSPDAEVVRKNLGLPRETESVSFHVLNNLLDQFAADPRKYRDELRALQEKYGEVLLPRTKIEQMREASKAIAKALEGL